MTAEFVRLSVGLEHIDDIVADLDQAWRLPSAEQAGNTGRLVTGSNSVECGIRRPGAGWIAVRD